MHSGYDNAALWLKVDTSEGHFPKPEPKSNQILGGSSL